MRREVHKGGDTCIIMADLCCFMTETTQNCKAISPPVIKKKIRIRNTKIINEGETICVSNSKLL